MSQSSEPAPDAPPPGGPALSPTERFFARMAAAQTVTAVVAVLISCAAMYAAWTQADATRIQIEAQTWPRIVSYVNMSTTDGRTDLFQVMVANHGVGPAEIRSMRVTLGGEPVTSFGDMFELMGGTGSAERSYSYVAGRIFAPGEAAAVITVRGPDEVARFMEVISAMEAEMCFCSILDSCWLAVQEAYTPVQTCPDYGAAQFRNQPDATSGRSPAPPPHTPDASME
jgi:hypothetical protein